MSNHEAARAVSLIGRTNVVVIGGGPAGMSTAIALARAGLTVAVLEQSRYEFARVGETLPPVVRVLLSRLGVWEDFLADGHAASPGILSAWGRGDLYDNDFILNPYGHGWHIDRRRFDESLAVSAESAGARIFRSAQVKVCAREPLGGWRIEADCDGQSALFRADFLVEATGRRSLPVRRSSARRIIYDRLVGVVKFIHTNASALEHDRRTLIEATEHGWWYSAPLPGSKILVTHMTDADLLPKKPASLDSVWQAQLRQAPHTRKRVEIGTLTPGLRIFAASSYRWTSVTMGDYLAAGDAAGTYDPLSSQGVYKALDAGLAAATAINDYLRGDNSALNIYAGEVEKNYTNYLQTRAAYYMQERRWPKSAFWCRRQSIQSLVRIPASGSGG